MRHVAALLEHTVDFSRSGIRDPELAADLFLSLVLGRLSRQCMLGIAVDPTTVEARVSASVKMFLGTGLVLRDNGAAPVREDTGGGPGEGMKAADG